MDNKPTTTYQPFDPSAGLELCRFAALHVDEDFDRLTFEFVHENYIGPTVMVTARDAADDTAVVVFVKPETLQAIAVFMDEQRRRYENHRKTQPE